MIDRNEISSNNPFEVFRDAKGDQAADLLIGVIRSEYIKMRASCAVPHRVRIDKDYSDRKSDMTNFTDSEIGRALRDKALSFFSNEDDPLRALFESYNPAYYRKFSYSAFDTPQERRQIIHQAAKDLGSGPINRIP